MTFDFHCRYGLFTYSQSDGLDHWKVLDHFTKLGAECIIGKESHADGGTHLHVFADWGHRKRFRTAHFADVDNYHPNIVPSRGTPALGWDYATKDGDVVAGGLGRPSDTTISMVRKDEVWHRILDASTREEFWELVRELAPADLARCYPNLSKYCDWRYAPPSIGYNGPTRGDIRFSLQGHPGLLRWLEAFDQVCNGQPGEFVLGGGILPSLRSGGLALRLVPQPPLSSSMNTKSKRGFAD